VTSVPRGGFADVTAKFYGEVDIPVCTTNRINTPEKGEEILAAGKTDMVSMARPLLADSEFVRKAEQGRGDEINTCSACCQARSGGWCRSRWPGSSHHGGKTGAQGDPV